MADDLIPRIVALAQEGAAHAETDEAARELREVGSRVNGPIRLAIAGKVKAGKSTLLNAIIGEELAPTDAGECTRIVTWYRHSDRPFAKVFPLEGDPVERSYRRGDGALQVDLGGFSAEQVDHMEIGWPSSRLVDLVLIDTPGIASISTDVSLRTHRAMTAEDGHPPVADAVMYLLRHTHSSDVRFLESFHDDEVARGTPVNTVGVLSRADEIGSSRVDAMQVADRIARRYQAEPRLHRLCPIVIPVNGLLGHAAATLREAEYADLVRIAGASDEEIADVLLTADRFAGKQTGIAVPAERRARLLERLGLFGVRLSVEQIRSGTAKSSVDLSARLADASGLHQLRGVVLRQFESRARVLKARSAVRALRDAFERGLVRDGSALLRRLEEITAGAHEFEEVRVLFQLRSGELSLTPAQQAELDRLMGGSGNDPTSRLGLAPQTTPDDVRQAAIHALGTWRSLERHPLSGRATQIAAQAATRTIEGILA